MFQIDKQVSKQIEAIFNKSLKDWLEDSECFSDQINDIMWDLIRSEIKKVLSGAEFRGNVRKLVSKVANNPKLIDAVVAGVTLELIKRS